MVNAFKILLAAVKATEFAAHIYFTHWCLTHLSCHDFL